MEEETSWPSDPTDDTKIHDGEHTYIVVLVHGAQPSPTWTAEFTQVALQGEVSLKRESHYHSHAAQRKAYLPTSGSSVLSMRTPLRRMHLGEPPFSRDA